MLNILFSDKEDWKIKTEGKYDKSKYQFHYANFETLKNIHRFDIVIPLFEKDIHILNTHFKKWGYKFLIPSNELVTFCNDKLKFNACLSGKGFNENIPEVLTNQPSSYPYILKKNIDEWGLNSHIIDNPEKEESLSAFVNNSDYFRQRYVEGAEEYTTHFVFTNNTLQYVQTFKFNFPKTRFVKGLESPPFKTAVIVPVVTEFASLFEKILQTIGYNGVGCFDYKIEQNTPKIFELNPRVGGSLPLDLINFIEAHHRICITQNLTVSSWTKMKSFLFVKFYNLKLLKKYFEHSNSFIIK